MSRSDQREQLVGLLQQPTYKSEQDRDNWDHYVAWCGANSRTLFVSRRAENERQVLAFLHTSRRDRGWSPSTARHYIGVIRARHKEAGYPDPAGFEVSGWFRACVRENGGERVLAKVDGITPEQIARAADNRPQVLNLAMVRRRGLVAAADVLGMSPFDPRLRELPASAFVVRADSIIITRPGTGDRSVLDAESQPIFHASLSTAITHAENQRRPLAEAKNGDQPGLVNAWRRAFAEDVDADTVMAASLTASPKQREWWLMNLDRNLQQRILDRSYLLVGVLGGHRHATLVRLTVGHIKVTRRGYRYEVAPNEDKGGLLAKRNGTRLRSVTRNVDHLEDDPDTCPVWCPACALRDHLAMRAHHGASGNSPLWVVAGRVASLSSEAQPKSTDGTRWLRRMLGEHIKGDQWVGTRSLRVTSATLARNTGMSVAEVSHHLGQYWSGSAEAYLRRLDPLGFDLVLTTNPPTQSQPVSVDTGHGDNSSTLRKDAVATCVTGLKGNALSRPREHVTTSSNVTC